MRYSDHMQTISARGIGHAAQAGKSNEEDVECGYQLGSSLVPVDCVNSNFQGVWRSAPRSAIAFHFFLGYKM